MPDALIAILLSLAAVTGTTIFHFEALRLVDRFSRRQLHAYIIAPTVISLVITSHLLEIGAYTWIYIVADNVLDIGSFSPVNPGALGMFYFAAETYSSLGLDDVMPHGALRLIVSIGSINGILLLAWSGSFLFAFANRFHRLSDNSL